MATKKSSIIYLSSLFIVFSSEIAFAVEKAVITDSSSSIQSWPLFVLLALLIVFRKQLFAEATPETHDDSAEHVEPVAEKVIKTEKVEAAETQTEQAKPAPTKKATKKTAKKPSGKVINLSDDNNQCQASTAKGSRCKRTNSLEQASVTIEGKTYQLTVCRQHNNDAIKPFKDLIK